MFSDKYLIHKKNGPDKGGDGGETFFQWEMLLKFNDIIPAQLVN